MLYAFTYLIWLPKLLHKMIWNSLEEALDIILLWNTFSSLLYNPRACFLLCLNDRSVLTHQVKDLAY